MAGILVGVDGSEHAQRALQWAIEEAERRQTPLRVLAVHPTPRLGMWPGMLTETFPDEEDRQRVEAAARAAFEKAAAAYGRPVTVEATVSAVIGNPIDELLRASKDAELVVVGSRGAGGFSRLLLGSVSTAVVHHADCPVVVIRPRHEHG